MGKKYALSAKKKRVGRRGGASLRKMLMQNAARSCLRGCSKRPRLPPCLPLPFLPRSCPAYPVDGAGIFVYHSIMHEFSLMASVLDRAAEEMERHGASRLTLLRLRYGELDHVQPDSMRMAFEAMTGGTPSEGARLELVEEPLLLRCPLCRNTFRPSGRESMFAPCPSCGKAASYSVEKGDGIILEHLEAE